MRDIRDTRLYREVEALHARVREPGSGQVSDAAEVHASPDGRFAVFSGTIMHALDGVPPTRVCRLDLKTGDTRVLTFGPNVDRLPKFSPDGSKVAFLSDRRRAGVFQLYLLDPISGAARAASQVEGWVEYLHWSPDGARILLGVAGHGADISGGQGAVASRRIDGRETSWMPEVETGKEARRWRSIWVYDLATDRMRSVSHTGSNVWEAVWCGNGALATVVSTDPGEGSWYAARLQIIELGRGTVRDVYVPQAQLGWPAGSPSGRWLAVVEALCSDRWLVAGDLRFIDVDSGAVQRVDTAGVDIAYTEWRSEELLLAAGHRGCETVVGFYSTASRTWTETWASKDLTTAGRYVTVSGFKEPGDCVLVGENFVRAPEIAVIRHGSYRPVKSFDLGSADDLKWVDAARPITWQAPDGLEIQGWLLLPRQRGPHPLVMQVHGGPVWHWRPVWLGRGGTALTLMKHGYAVFLPNPRGSSGRGQDFVRHVVGDMGGADARDCLSGLDHLIEQSIADPRRLGVMGQSYGGFMTAWLIGQDPRFAAAVTIAPVVNQVTEHLLSNIPNFVTMFLSDHYTNLGGKYFERSPIMNAHKAKTPTLNICGALDRCTPPEEAMQFHNALLEGGTKSVLVTYPEEGHGVRAFPAAIDFTARVVHWFEEHIPRTNAGGRNS